MGFFNKVKENLHHGGVKVQLQAPASVSMNDPALAATVTVTASDQAAQIKSVKLEIVAQSNNAAFSQPTRSTTPVNNSQGMSQTVAQAENAQAFALNAGESRAIPLSIMMNVGATTQSQAPGSVGAEVASALGKVQSISEYFNNNSYTYTLHATVDVDGVALDPSTSQPLQILKPGQFGTAVNLKL